MTTPDPFAPGYRLTDGNQLNDRVANPQWSTTSSLTAKAGGTVFTSARIVDTVTQITAASAPNAGVVIEQALPGRLLWIVNDAPNTVVVFAEGGSTIDGIPGDIGITLAAGANIYLIATDVNTWQSYLGVPNGYGTGFVNIVTNITALRAWSTSAANSPKIVALVYNNVAGDGGGLFYLDAADHVTPDNGTTVIVDAVGNRWKRELVQATYIANTPAGTVAATTVQGAIDELDLEKVSYAALAASSGSSLVGYTQGGTGAVARTAQAKFRDSVSVKDFGATGDGVTDDAAAIQAAIDYVYGLLGGEVFFPTGRYVIKNTLKIQLTYANNICIKLRGTGSGVATVSPAATGGSIIVGETGGALLASTNGIMIDMSGGCNTIFEDIGLIAGATNPSQIGIFLQRVSASGNGFCSNNKFVRMAIGMGTIPGANGGVGTIAIMNKRGEHHTHDDCWYYADTPIILDGNSKYGPASANPILSPFYAESFPGGATLGVNLFRQCLLYSIHNVIEAFSVNNLTLQSVYVAVRTGYVGVLIEFGQNIIMDATNIEYTGVAPTSADTFIKVIGNFYGLRINATSNIPGYTLVSTDSGAALFEADIVAANANFGAIFDQTTYAGGDLWGGNIKYNSNWGHTVPDIGINNSILMDVNNTAAGAQQIDIRTLQETTAFVSGYGAVLANTDGNDTVTLNTVTYVSELNISASTLLTGASVLTGSVANGNAKIYLIDRAGAVVAQTASFSVTGSTFQFVGNNFTTAYFAKGPGRYYVAVQCDNGAGTNRIRTFTLGAFGATGRSPTVYGTLSNSATNAPTTFVANVGPIVTTY
jgi:hypothetical protein